ncbi:MAG TPA: hypothetical protein VN088_13865 [Nocardioides sp.]|nr:hypothetical protein [Nocardioides sp.]
MRTLPYAAAALALPLLVSGCGGTTSAQPAPTTPAPTTTAPTTGTSPAGAAHNLTLTPTVIHQLVVAGAAAKQVPASGFSGLGRTQRYYAYDPATHTWWAAGGMEAKNPDAGAAAVSLNDAGSYDVFHRTAGGHWVARESGGAGGPDQPLSKCDDWPPRSVLRLWHWSLKVCRAPA